MSFSFMVRCSCGKGMGVDISRQQAELRDAVAVLRTLSPQDKLDVAHFYEEHRTAGHSPQPSVAEVSPMPKA